MRKLSENIEYGNLLGGHNRFDDETDVPIVHDPETGEDWLSPMMAGILSDPKEGYDSTLAEHRTAAGSHGDMISEWESNTLASDPDALEKYVDRYVRTMEKYKAEHGKYPKQRVIGHSRGGGGAIELMKAISEAHPELPQFDEFIGLDPYDLPNVFGKKDRKRKDGRLLAKRSIVVRPQNLSVLNPDDVHSPFQRVYKGIGNGLLQFAERVNPLSSRRSLSVAVPDTSHNSLVKLMNAAMLVRKARRRAELKKLVKDLGWKIERPDSPQYGDPRRPVYYEKEAQEVQDAPKAPDVPAAPATKPKTLAWGDLDPTLQWGLGGAAAGMLSGLLMPGKDPYGQRRNRFYQGLLRAIGAGLGAAATRGAYSLYDAHMNGQAIDAAEKLQKMQADAAVNTENERQARLQAEVEARRLEQIRQYKARNGKKEKPAVRTGPGSHKY